MFCHRCGEEIVSNEIKNCIKCGALIDREDNCELPKNNKKIGPLKSGLIFLAAVCISIISCVIAVNSGIDDDKMIVSILVGAIVFPFLALIAIHKDDKGRWIGAKAIFYTIAVLIGIQAAVAVYDNIKMNTALDIANVGEDDLESGVYVEGTIYKVLSKIKESNGVSYYIVMLPSTDMTDWNALNKNYYGQVLDLASGKFPLTEAKAEDRRVVAISTDNKNIAKIFDKMVEDNEHFVLSKIFRECETYTGIFKVKDLSYPEQKEEIQAAAVGKDELGDGLIWDGINLQNICYYELSVCESSSISVLDVIYYIICVLWIVFILKAFVSWLIRPKKVNLINDVAQEMGQMHPQRKKTKISPIFLIIFVAFLCIATPIIVTISMEANTQSQVDEVVNTLFETVKNDDNDGFVGCFHPEVSDDERISTIKSYLIKAKNGEMSIVGHGGGVDEEEFGEKYNVNVTDSYSVDCVITYSNHEETISIKLVKIDDKWYVWGLTY